LVLKDRVKESSNTTGTGTFSLGGAYSGFQSFSVIGNSNTTYYAIVNLSAAEWEVGIGTYTASGATLSRDTILESSNSGSAVNFSAGTKDVFCTYPAEKSITTDILATPPAIGATTPAAGAFTTIIGTDTTDASSTTAAAVKTAGGLAVAKKLYVGTGGAVVDGITVGKGAGSVATNTAVGASALAANTTGAGNTSLGAATLQANTTASNNTAVGYGAMNVTTTGANNTAVGYFALINNTTASSSTAVGYQAAYTHATGNPVTAVGYQAAYSDTGGGITAMGWRAGYGNTSGVLSAAFGELALYTNTSGSNNTALGFSALYSNTTASNNTAVGYQAAYSNTTGVQNVAIGYSALASVTTSNNNTAIGANAGLATTTGGANVFMGINAGYSNTTGSGNTFVGSNSASGAGYYMTTGSKNTILGGYNGNQGGLDIRTASNYIVLSDGDGNPRIYNTGGSTTLVHSLAVGTGIILTWSGDFYAYPCDQGSFNAAQAGLKIQKIGATNRSLNAAGTINASGADYAEYMTKCSADFTVAKGDVVGINSEGKLTNVFADAIAFVVKSTDPSYVGGDTWGVKSQSKDGPQYTEEELEEQRQWVDRIAFSGQVPVNVTGATAGQYIVPVNDNGAIKGEAVSNPTFEQYQQAVGKVIAIEQDGRARIIVKVA
jgi:hypothetical protein